MEVKAAADELLMSGLEILGSSEDKELEDNDEDIEKWVDEDSELTDEECEELKIAILPVQHVLVKLHQLSFKMINLTTKLLPVWKAKLEELKLKARLMLHDI
ncbi:hypothetical protein DXG01_012968 [Tephrocybe rancida]|nr:hypothetical protein DXG01_012968 [Tephrocybe rancida]